LHEALGRPAKKHVRMPRPKSMHEGTPGFGATKAGAGKQEICLCGLHDPGKIQGGGLPRWSVCFKSGDIVVRQGRSKETPTTSSRAPYGPLKKIEGSQN